jgi:hypothetical protein
MMQSDLARFLRRVSWPVLLWAAVGPLTDLLWREEITRPPNDLVLIFVAGYVSVQAARSWALRGALLAAVGTIALFTVIDLVGQFAAHAAGGAPPWTPDTRWVVDHFAVGILLGVGTAWQAKRERERVSNEGTVRKAV